MKELCALLLAGGMGAGSVVAVQQAKPTVQKPAKPKVAKPVKAVQRNAPSPQLQECPTVAPAVLAPIQIAEQAMPFTIQPSGEPLLPGGGGGSAGGGGGLAGGGGSGGTSIVPDPSPIPGVPQPDTWVMLVAGFGFMGLALRRSPNRPGSRQQEGA